MFKKKAKRCIKELNSHIHEISPYNRENDFQCGYVYGLRVAIVIISRIFKIK